MLTSIQGQYMFKDMFYKEGFPQEEKLHDFLEELETEFVRIINLGGGAQGIATIQQYREGNFKSRLGLR